MEIDWKVDDEWECQLYDILMEIKEKKRDQLEDSILTNYIVAFIQIFQDRIPKCNEKTMGKDIFQDEKCMYKQIASLMTPVCERANFVGGTGRC